MPDADRLHRASKAADRVAVYTQKDPRQLLGSLAGKKIHKAEAIRIHSLDRAFVDSVARKLDRRTKLSLSVTERQLYANVNGADIQGELHEHTIPS
jgi:uncharacterized protein YaeQ